MRATSTDALRIGGGVIGSSIAYFLAHQGRHGASYKEDLRLLTRLLQSWASAGGVRRQGRDPAEAMLASEAIQFWKTLEQELETEVGYRQGGNLLLAENEIEVNFLFYNSSIDDMRWDLQMSNLLIELRHFLLFPSG